MQEVEALTARYLAALEEARLSGSSAVLSKFDDSVKGAAAVINVELLFLFHLLSSEKELYSTYQLGVRGQIRKPAPDHDDRHRAGVEGVLFGTYGENIRYAALSLDGAGLTSYGRYSVKLRDIAVADRASLLEENSYSFVTQYGIVAGQPIPRGHRATWPDRHKLAVAKLAKRITAATTETAFPRILLLSDGKKAEDDFIEVHIYGPLDANTIESVRGKAKIRKNRALAASAKEYALKGGKVWIEA